MITLRRVLFSLEWTLALWMSYSLLKFGADQLSHAIATAYVDGNLAQVHTWRTALGLASFVSVYSLLYGRIRFYAASAVALVLAADSLLSLSNGQLQTVEVSLMSLAAALLALLSKRPRGAIKPLAGLGEQISERVEGQTCKAQTDWIAVPRG